MSACIIAFNEEDRIADCIRSLQWCDEVLVVDSHSTDRTREVAGDCGARVIEREWPGYVLQKEFAIRAACYDWVLCIDADERVSAALRAEMLALRDSGLSAACGWKMPRMSCYLGRWIRHGTWYPDLSLRLFDRRHGRWVGHRLHERVELDSDPGRLKGDLLHFPYRSFAEHLRTIDNYTTIMARDLHERGGRASLLDLIFRPAVRFFRFYVLKAGFLEGWCGLLLAYLAAYYVRLKYAKLLVMERETPPAPPPD